MTAPRIYRVGGCVRDDLLRQQGFDIEPADKDWVVVGATPEWMVAQGFLPVGADFPVFLHPKTHEEYALARTERKTARGYHGFRFYAQNDVTLEEDLKRRDLTINAMAQDDEGTIIDPYGGQSDIKNRVFRHVSAAFAEDPVRILRLARFAARFPEFTVAPETNDLARRMVENGETDALVAERVFKEFSRAFAEKSPERTLKVLLACGFWQRAFGDIEVTEKLLEQIRRAATQNPHADIVTALVFGRNPDTQKVRERLKNLRADSATVSLCEMVSRLLTKMPGLSTPKDFAELFTQADVLRRPERFQRFIETTRAVDPQFDFARLNRAYTAFLSVNAAQIALRQTHPADIGPALLSARLEAIRNALQ